MRGLDDTDREILGLLLEDARRPYSDIAEAVDLSPPAVSDRVDRLRELGLIRRFTVDLDRSMLREGVPVLLELRVRPGAAESVADGLADVDRVEHVFRTADARVVATATVEGGEVAGLLPDGVDPDAVRDLDVSPLAGKAWTPRLDEAALAPSCAECGNTVTAEGESARLDGRRYLFCCSSCHERFLEQYERLSEEAE